MTDEEVLSHFDSKPEFRNAFELWDSRLTQLFCRLARAINHTSLDWYHVTYHVKIGGKLRFGRRNLGDKVAYTVAGCVKVGRDHIRVNSNSKWAGGGIKAIPEDVKRDLDSALLQDIEEELKNWNGIPDSLKLDRDGLWPDDYHEADLENESRPAEPSPPHSLNTILYGPPGTGKTYATFRRCVEICDNVESPDEEAVGDRYRELVKEGRVEFVTFHQSYGYEEFVEGLRPQTNSTDSNGDSGAGFRLEPEHGVLKRIADRARKVSDPYVLVIDEINRGNISKVFGEAITLVEKDKRSGLQNEISVTLPYSRKPFTLPANLYILGTMNTADRSIALLDTALRRRFDFEELAPKPALLAEIGGINLPAVLKSMNERLEWLLSRDHLIGHAWLMGASDKLDVDRIMRRKIVPMLAEYFHDDWRKVQAVLGGASFVKKTELKLPKGLDDDQNETRYSWTYKEPPYPETAYRELIKGEGPAAPSAETRTD
ncbi:MAG: AAA family ATPase [Rhodobacteraceae bacterium]|nr:AAA family ATPase [Paracoccaceae bacterium]MCY4140789.1 AAA family ATPase [Paracoccaceae bacterium]